MALPTVDTTRGLIKTTRFSHGTLECHNLATSRRFYEEFLGLECVRHGKPPAILVRKGGSWALVAVQVGDRVHPQHVLNHWGVDVPSKEVDRAYQLALQYQATYGLKKIMPPTTQHGAYSFYLEDCDSNWWEIQYVEEGNHDRMFARGDVVPAS